MTDQPVGARELRRQIRQWRRGRADASILAVVNDVYVAVVSTLLLGSMLGSVLVHTGALTASACHSGPCQGARFWAPLLIVLGVVTVVGALARVCGPVFVSAALASWLLRTPVPRRSLLVGPLLSVALVGAGLVGAAAVASTAVAGYGAGAVVAATAAGLLLGLLLVGIWALLQPTEGARPLRTAVAWLPGIALEAGLLLTWHGDLHGRPVPRRFDDIAVAVVMGLLAVATVALAVAVHRLDRLRDRDMAAGGHLGAALSGALATLDLALVYDVLTGQRWRRRGHVRARRGGPSGLGALIWLDVIRLWRSPSRLLLILAAVPVPYAAKALGAGAATSLIAVLVGFLAALPMLNGVRVLTRTPGLVRMLPYPLARTQTAALAVPAACLLCYGLLLLGVSAEPLPIALGALAAATRWVTGRPPDYGRPLLSTPAGAAPPNLYGSVFRGFDIVLLTGLPLLIPRGEGVLISLIASVVVLAVLLNRRPNR